MSARDIDTGTFIRWGVVIAGLVFLVVLVVYQVMHRPADSEKKSSVWNAAMTKGSESAENHFIEYTDMMCPYCSKFARALESGAEQFENDYIKNNKVLFELRLANIVGDHNVNGERSNVTGYCAAKQEGKFWLYYNALQEKLWQEFYSKGIADKKGAPEMPQLDDNFYFDVARDNGLDIDQMKECLADGAARAEMEKNTRRTQNSIQSGVPYFVFNSYASSGFDDDYNTVRMMFEAGLKGK
jgi:protein-disulfide isomerase